ncbi:MAG: hypothetical protein KC616_26250, partial [Myxococcales bacterium]|nr:hypothetical protein [Myxococcales bacterium]
RPPSGLEELVAGCILHHATVLGDVRPASTAADSGLGREWPRLRVGERKADAPREDLVPADPGEVVAFVARYLDAFGERLAAGDLILAGSYMAQALPIGPGEEAVADYGALGSVSVRAVA